MAGELIFWLRSRTQKSGGPGKQGKGVKGCEGESERVLGLVLLLSERAGSRQQTQNRDTDPVVPDHPGDDDDAR